MRRRRGRRSRPQRRRGASSHSPGRTAWTTPRRGTSHRAAIVSAAASSGLSVAADVSPNTARLLGGSPWAFLRPIGVARVRVDCGLSVPATQSIAHVLPIALKASAMRAADLRQPERRTDPQLLPAEVDRAGVIFGCWVDENRAPVRLVCRRFIPGASPRRGPLGGGLPGVEGHRSLPP